MSEKKSLLKYLLGQIVNDVGVDVSTVISLKEKEDDQSGSVMSLYTQIMFDQYRLDIYNKTEIRGGMNANIRDLVGLKVIDTNETNENAELLFDNGYRLIVDLRPEAYSSDPEAMCLQGPNNLIVVWD